MIIPLTAGLFAVFTGFITPGSDLYDMDLRYGLLAAACIALVIAAGCTGASPTTNTPVPTTAPALSTTVPTVPSASPSAISTTSCPEDVCRFIPGTMTTTQDRSLRIVTFPQRYSLMMSSTPGIGLDPVATGFNATTATFSWNASYGQFLSWDALDYTVDPLGSSVSGPGKKLYWSFSDSPADTNVPVTITVTAKDPASGTVWGSSAVTLAWDGNYTVTVQNKE